MIRKTMTSSSGRTPPRLRCLNVKPTLRPSLKVMKQPVINIGAENDINSEEDFSFQKLRGAVKSFEQKQQQHFSKNMNSSHKHAAAPLSSSVLQNRDRITENVKKDTPSHTRPLSQIPKNDIKEKKPLSSRKSLTSMPPRTPSPNELNTSTSPSANEDFSFQALKQRALKMEGNRGISSKVNNIDDADDFSFQKLKQKAVHIEQHGASTPIRSNSRISPRPTSSNSRPSTPVRTQQKSFTPARTPTTRSVPMTPPKTLSILSSKKEVGGVPTPNRTAAAVTAFNPHRYKFAPKIKKEEVQATDNSIASVKKISKWLSDDPFEKKKQVAIRKGQQIAQKSKAFENDEVLKGLSGRKETRVEREREHFPDGKVSQGKSWLKNAFGEVKVVEEDFSGVVGKQKMIQNAFKKKSLK